MKCLRNESILVSAEYINSFTYTKERLIDLFYFLDRRKNISENVLTKLVEDFLGNFKFPKLATLDPDVIKDSTYDGESEIIRGNSFGPFNPDEYFKDGNFRILWILKEPYVKNGEYEALISGLREFLGGHDQGKQYFDEGWSVIKLPAKDGGNPTIANLIRISKVILEELWGPFNGNDEEAIMKQVMGHICILEVNHFPGLAFQSSNSNDDLIGEWAQWNEELIRELIGFYNPNVIIGGNTLGHFYPDGYKLIGEGNTHSFDHIKEGIKNGNEMFKILGLTILKDETDYMQVRKDYLFKTKEGIILVDSSHPSRYSKAQSEENGKQIKHWYESETQIKVTKF